MSLKKLLWLNLTCDIIICPQEYFQIILCTHFLNMNKWSLLQINIMYILPWDFLVVHRQDLSSFYSYFRDISISVLYFSKRFLILFRRSSSRKFLYNGIYPMKVNNFGLNNDTFALKHFTRDINLISKFGIYYS